MLIEGWQNSDFQRTHSQRFWSTAIDWRGNREGNEESVDELDDENLPLFYTRPSFQRASGNYVPPEPSTKTKSEHWLGPVRVLDGSKRRWIIFSCFIQTQFCTNLFNSQMTMPPRKNNNNNNNRGTREEQRRVESTDSHHFCTQRYITFWVDSNECCQYAQST